MILTIPFSHTVSSGEALFCDARMPEDGENLPVLLFAHGFKGFKDWGSFPTVCTMLAEQGYYVLSFNFSHNGVEEHSTEFTRLDKFRRNTFSREVQEMSDLVDAAYNGFLPESHRIDRNRIGVIGHSRGGGIAILTASRNKHIAAVATWGSVADFNRYTEAQKKRWRENGVFETKNMRTGQIMPLGLELLEDIETNTEALSIELAAASLHRPFLIVHGEQDLAVKPDNAQRLQAAADPAHTTLLIIPATGHTFGAAHPFTGMTEALTTVIDATAQFFQSIHKSNSSTTED